MDVTHIQALRGAHRSFLSEMVSFGAAAGFAAALWCAAAAGLREIVIFLAL